MLSWRNHLLNCPGRSNVCSPLPARITPNRAQQSFPMTWGTRAMPRNGGPPIHWRRWRPWRFDCCVTAKSPTKLPRRKNCMFSPPSSNHNKPKAAIVTHDGGNVRVVPERAYSSHWWWKRPWRFDCCVAAKSPTKLPRRNYCIFSPHSLNHNKPRAAVVTHDEGNAHVAPERAYSSHGRQ